MRARTRNEVSVMPILALCLVGLVVLLQTGFQTAEALRERRILDEVMTEQADRLRSSGEERATLEGLVNGTLKLADEGDKGAQGIVERMNLSRLRNQHF